MLFFGRPNPFRMSAYSRQSSARLALSALLVLISPVLAGAEIDSYTLRQQPLADASDELNDWFNQHLREGVARANEAGEGCQPELLYRHIRRAFAKPFIGHLIAESLNAEPDLPKYRVSLEQSIYRDMGVVDGVSLHLRDLSAVMNVNGTLIGTDKIGHFLVEGWSYFQKGYLDEDVSLDEAMRWGAFTERTYFGLMTTGMLSYADLAANFDGMRFWLHLLGEERDPIAGLFQPRPYLSCRKRALTGDAWQLKREVHLEKYVNPAWDEAVNCQTYRNPEIAILVNRRILQQKLQGGGDQICPIKPKACDEAASHYGEYRYDVIHPRCLESAPASKPWWKWSQWRSDNERNG